jgi:hypothetical protein
VKEQSNPEIWNLWEAFITNNSNGTIFQSKSWLSLFGEVELYVKEDMQGNVLCGCALVQTKKYGQKGWHIPPYSPYFGPVYSEQEKPKLVQEALTKLLGEIPLKGHNDFILLPSEFSLPFIWNGFTPSLGLTHIAKGTWDDFLKTLNKNRVREYKKLLGAFENGDLTYDFNPQPEDIISLLKETAKRSGFNPKLDHVRRIVSDETQNFTHRIIVYSKEFGPISAGVFVHDQHRVYNIINASKRPDHKVYKTINLFTLLYGIKYALDQGKLFDFEGSSIKGVEAFYAMLGGQKMILHRYQKSKSLKFQLMRSIKRIKNEWI